MGAHDLVVGFDGSPASRRAVDWAAAAAAATGRRLVLATVTGSRAAGWGEVVPSTRRFLLDAGRRNVVVGLLHVRRTAPGLDVRSEVRVGETWVQLADHARHAALTVLGARHQTLVSRLGTGSVARRLIDAAPGPLALVPDLPDPAGPAPSVVGRVVVLVGLETGQAAVAFGYAEALHRSCDLLVIRPGGPRRPRAAPLLSSLDLGGVRVERRYVEDHRDAVHRHLRRTDMLVLGDHLPGAPRRALVDRVVDTLVQRPGRPVLVVPDAGTRQERGRTTLPGER